MRYSYGLYRISQKVPESEYKNKGKKGFMNFRAITIVFIIAFGLSACVSQPNKHGVNSGKHEKHVPSSLISRFDSEIEGWTIANAGATTRLRLSTEREGSVYFEGQDSPDDKVWFYRSPKSWSGDWSEFDFIKFDLKIIDKGNGARSNQARAKIVGENGGLLNWFGDKNGLGARWSPQNIKLTSDTFGVPDSYYQSVISNVESIWIAGDYTIGRGITGLDNVRMSAIPKPVSCVDIKNNKPDSTSGMYTVRVYGKSFDIYCDMETDGGGWDVIINNEATLNYLNQFGSVENIDSTFYKDKNNGLGWGKANDEYKELFLENVSKFDEMYLEFSGFYNYIMHDSGSGMLVLTSQAHDRSNWEYRKGDVAVNFFNVWEWSENDKLFPTNNKIKLEQRTVGDKKSVVKISGYKPYISMTSHISKFPDTKNYIKKLMVRNKSILSIKKESSPVKKELPPILSFYNAPETFDSENVSISILVKDQGSGSSDIFLSVNGSEIASNKDRSLTVKRAASNVKTLNIKLQNGFNEIRAYAFDKNKKVKSLEIVHKVVASYDVVTKPKLYAVVIGIDQFEDSSMNLKYAEADASLFGTTLFKRSRDMFSKIDIAYMKKMEGTSKQAILSQLDSLKDISANDFFVFYSATHGIEYDGKYYMVTSNVSSNNKENIKENAITEDELRESFRNIPTANKLLLFDTCYSGAVNERVSKRLANSTIKQLNLTSITAASSVQTAIEGFADGHGIFTYIISDALDGEADINHDGVVQSMELVNYANKWVPIEAYKFNHIQTPAYFQTGQVFNVAKLRQYKGPINMQPQYFQPEEVKQLITYMDKNDVRSLNKVIETNKFETKKVIEKIKKEALKVESQKAVETIKRADKKFSFGQHNFIFNDNSIFLDIKDPIKEHFNFTDDEGRHLVVFDFHSNDQNPRVVQSLDTIKVSDIYMADRGDWYRVTLQTKSKQTYKHVVNKDGIYIKLVNN